MTSGGERDGGERERWWWSCIFRSAVAGSTPPSDSCVCEESITEKGDVCYMNRVCVFETVREMKGMIQRGRDR